MRPLLDPMSILSDLLYIEALLGGCPMPVGMKLEIDSVLREVVDLVSTEQVKPSPAADLAVVNPDVARQSLHQIILPLGGEALRCGIGEHRLKGGRSAFGRSEIAGLPKTQTRIRLQHIVPAPPQEIGTEQWKDRQVPLAVVRREVDGRREPVLLQNRKGGFCKIVKPVIEGDHHASRWKVGAIQSLDRLTQGKNPEGPGLQQLHALSENLGRHKQLRGPFPLVV